MPIEESINALTEAVKALTAAIGPKRSAEVAPAPAPAPVPAPAPKKPKKSGHSEIAPPVEVPPETTEATSAPAEEQTTSPVITIATLRGIAEELLAKNRLPDIIAINKKFGIKKITEAPEEMFLDLHDALKDALNRE